MASSRDTPGNKNIHLPLHEIIHDQFLAGKLLIEMQHIDHIAVGELEADCGRRIRRSSRRLCGGLRIDCLNGLNLWALRNAPSENHGRAGKHERRDTEKPVHSPLLLNWATSRFTNPSTYFPQSVNFQCLSWLAGTGIL